ncbi:MAG: TetR/AcrR family transcriptional regulator [Lachnospiraceae bacterium]|nr:TetR/AcrR family transcriptional regulator [Lachnospiraceae bacterium]
MARKPVLTGGKRDEIIKEAMKLFFENGYEATSVRTIMDRVGGEIGMFYHYFKSKEELFDKVTESFFKGYEERFGALVRGSRSPEELVDTFLPLHSESMDSFGKIKGNMHWTIQYAMHLKTIMALKPVVTELITQWGVKHDASADMLAGQLLYGISATIHSDDFEKMSDREKRETVISFVRKIFYD